MVFVPFLKVSREQRCECFFIQVCAWDLLLTVSRMKRDGLDYSYSVQNLAIILRPRILIIYLAFVSDPKVFVSINCCVPWSVFEKTKNCKLKAWDSAACTIPNQFRCIPWFRFLEVLNERLRKSSDVEILFKHTYCDTFILIIRRVTFYRTLRLRPQ